MNINELELYSQELINRYGLTQAEPTTMLMNTDKVWSALFGTPIFKESIRTSIVIDKKVLGATTKKFIQKDKSISFSCDGSEGYANAA